MKTNPRSGMALAVALSLAGALGACGGGGGGGDVAVAAPVATAQPDTVPPEASLSTQAFIDYQKTLVADNTIEPKALQQLLPPLSDTTEPTPLN